MRPGFDGLGDTLAQGAIVDVAGWHSIDAAERERGKTTGKPREKFVRVAEMLHCLPTEVEPEPHLFTGARKAFEAILLAIVPMLETDDDRATPPFGVASRSNTNALGLRHLRARKRSKCPVALR